MKNIKQLGLLVLLVGLVVPNGTFASGNEDKDQKTVPQKIGKETKRVVGQIKNFGKDLEIGWKEQDQKDQKAYQEKKAQQKADKNKGSN